jgi:hypothetical protein
MTEQEWLTSTAVDQMLEFVRDKATQRKFRLHGSAFCRAFWHMRSDPGCRRALDLNDDYAEGRVSAADLVEVRRSHARLTTPLWAELVDRLLRPTWDAHGGDSWTASTALTPSEHGDLIRDIFGNPFRKPAFHPAWLTSNVVLLAEAIYAERAFDRMPILGDALEDAGCTSAALLEHCREGSSHVRGCWLVDLLLAKS